MPKFHVSRSIEIDAASETVFDTVADFKTWPTWSPWLCAEPDAEVKVSDNSNSVGSMYSWKGEIVGQGEMEHQNLERGRLIEEEIRFVKPFKSKSKVVFEFEPVGSGTKITWHMHGSLPFFLFFMKPMMETFIGMDYERGLKMLKDWLETGEIISSVTNHGVESVEPLRMAGIRGTCSIGNVGKSMEQAFEQAARRFEEAGLSTDAGVMSVYHSFDVKARTFDYTSGFILPDSTGAVPEDLSSWSKPTGRALHYEHLGKYEHLGNAWSAAHQYMRYKRLKQSKVGTYEIYRNDPCSTDPAELKTDIYLPLK